MLELSQRSHKSLLALGPFPSLQSRNFAGLININGTCCSMLQRVVAASWNQSINQIFRDQVACITFSVIPKIIVKNCISKCETCKNMRNTNILLRCVYAVYILYSLRSAYNRYYISNEPTDKSIMPQVMQLTKSRKHLNISWNLFRLQERERGRRGICTDYNRRYMNVSLRVCILNRFEQQFKAL